MYHGLESDFIDDPDLQKDLETAKDKLKSYYETHYASQRDNPLVPGPINSLSSNALEVGGSSLTACYKRWAQQTRNELEDFLKLDSKDFDTCCPFEWWHSWKGFFPNLYRLACDILLIPGKLHKIYLFCDEITYIYMLRFRCCS